MNENDKKLIIAVRQNILNGIAQGSSPVGKAMQARFGLAKKVAHNG